MKKALIAMSVLIALLSGGLTVAGVSIYQMDGQIDSLQDKAAVPGPPGPQGIQGPRGPAGADGADGADGSPCAYGLPQHITVVTGIDSFGDVGLSARRTTITACP